MPYLMVQTNRHVDQATSESFVSRASSLVSDQLGKSEGYVMVSLQPPTPMAFAGKIDPAAYLELKSIGLPEKATTSLSNALCQLVSSELGIDKERIYIEFANSESHMWGWNCRTF